MPSKKTTIIQRRALLIEQDPKHPLYVFALTAAELHTVADVSRISRDDAGKLLGYQRPEVKQHVQEIVEYLDGDNVLFPNPIILALEPAVRFVRSRGPNVKDGLVTAGTLEIPVPGPNAKKPAWIVDGQQRALALSKARHANFPFPVNGFIAGELEMQRDQFIRINNSKPLRRGLLTELLPEISGPLPARLAVTRIPAALCDLLSREANSPLFGLIRRASQSKASKTKAPITDTSVIKMIEESLTHPSGCLFPHRNIATGETDSEMLYAILRAYWQGVKETFPDAWGKSATQSRLMGGVGIRSMGRLMDKVMSGIDPLAKTSIRQVKRELKTVAPVCKWTAGEWEELGLRWNEIQNVPRHINAVTNVLIRTYVHGQGLGR